MKADSADGDLGESVFSRMTVESETIDEQRRADISTAVSNMCLTDLGIIETFCKHLGGKLLVGKKRSRSDMLQTAIEEPVVKKTTQQDVQQEIERLKQLKNDEDGVVTCMQHRFGVKKQRTDDGERKTKYQKEAFVSLENEEEAEDAEKPINQSKWADLYKKAGPGITKAIDDRVRSM